MPMTYAAWIQRPNLEETRYLVAKNASGTPLYWEARNEWTSNLSDADAMGDHEMAIGIARAMGGYVLTCLLRDGHVEVI